MTRCIAAILALAASAAMGGCSATGRLAATDAAPAVTELHSTLADAIDAGRIPGAIVVIERNGQPLAEIVLGHQDIAARQPLARDAIFRLYSMSKPITSLAIMMLAEDGLLALDDPAEKYLPEWRGPEGRGPESRGMRVYASGDLDNMITVPATRPITIADLLTHTAGITYHFTGDTPVQHYYRKYGVMRDTPVGRMAGDGAPARDLDQLVERLGRAPMLHQPGERFSYSYSTTVLGAIIERVSGERLDRFLQQRLFDPLGMTDTGFFVSDADLPRFTTLYAATPDGLSVIEQPARSDYRDLARLLDGGGAIAGTADDYLRFARMLANGGTLDGKRIASEATIDAMLVPRVGMAGAGGPGGQFGYGFAIGDAASEAAGGLPAGTASWSGSGNTYFFIDRGNRAAALAMTHFMGGGQAQQELQQAVNRAYLQLVRD